MRAKWIPPLTWKCCARKQRRLEFLYTASAVSYVGITSHLESMAGAALIIFICDMFCVNFLGCGCLATMALIAQVAFHLFQRGTATMAGIAGKTFATDMPVMHGNTVGSLEAMAESAEVQTAVTKIMIAKLGKRYSAVSGEAAGAVVAVGAGKS